MFRHLFELCSRTTIISVWIDGNTTTWSKDSGYFNVFGIHEAHEVFHYYVYAVLMEVAVVAETEEVEFEALALYHLGSGNIVYDYASEVGLACLGAQRSELGACECYEIFVFGVLVWKRLKHFGSVVVGIFYSGSAQQGDVFYFFVCP